jgi:hypothetical protein
MFGGRLLPLMLVVSANKFGVVTGGAATPQVLHLPSKSGKILAKFDPNSSQTLLRK